MSTTLTESSTQSVSDVGGSWNTNVVWKSFETEEWEKFERFQHEAYRQNYRVQGPKFIPPTFRDYSNHRLTILEEEIRKLKLKIEAKERQSRLETQPSTTGTTRAFGGKNVDAVTGIFAAMIPQSTMHDVAENVDSDLDFVAKAEFFLGKGLLKEL